ncbi:hypothetical protein N7507_002442 [Penicillium longicatenatum]|nr:hypothetical protein N7507_002442 [Penicillium longicatenatum]
MHLQTHNKVVIAQAMGVTSIYNHLVGERYRWPRSFISILLRPRFGFTRRLLDRIEPNRDCGAWIDGPFGPFLVGWQLNGSVGDYGHVFMIATGIGIAAQLPYIKELLDGHDVAQVRTQRISLVWQLNKVGDYESAEDLLQSLVKQDNAYVRQILTWRLIVQFIDFDQILHVSIYDSLNTESEGMVQNIGENGLINARCGFVDWKDKLNSEMKCQVGKMLVLVSLHPGSTTA